MKKELIAFSLFFFLTSSIISHVSIASNVSLLDNGDDDYLDQYQDEYEIGYAADGGSGFEYAQSFKPTYNILTRIKLNTGGGGWVGNKPHALIFTVRKDLNGNNLVASSTHDFKFKWFEIDFYDTQVTPEETYYILWGDVGGNAFFPSTDGNHYYLRGKGYTCRDSNSWHGAGRDFCFKTYGRNGTDGNNPPETPEPVSISVDGIIGETCTYSFKSEDIDGDNVKLKIDWGDGNDPTITEEYQSGKTISVQHIWEKPGVYWMTVTTMDEHGSESLNLELDPVYIKGHSNTPPMKPELDGDREGAFNKDLQFSAITYDCDRQDIYYLFDWGDNTDSGWLGPFQSGETCTVKKSWSGFLFTDYYDVRVLSKDSWDAKSEWSESIEVKVYQGRLKYKTRNNFLQKFPMISNLISNIFFS